MSRIKNILMVAIPVALCLLICSGCGKQPVPVLNVTLLDKQEDATSYVYYTVYDNGKAEKTAPFALDDTAEFYTTAYKTSNMENIYIQPRFSLQNTLLLDSDGEIIEADESTIELMQAVADTMKHDIAQLTIVKVEDQMFAFVWLNVNWFSPCELYRYDTETKTLGLLCKWDNVDITGVAIPQKHEQ